MAIDLKLKGWLMRKAEVDGPGPAVGDAGGSAEGREALAGATIMEDLGRRSRGSRGVVL